jgi:hypothetical protein
METYYYVIQKNLKTNEETLLLFNGNEEEKNEKFYCYHLNDPNSHCSLTDEFQNYYGCHVIKFKNYKTAYKELITKPNEFNNALKIIQKYGLMVVSKYPIVSYQSFHETFNVL